MGIWLRRLAALGVLGFPIAVVGSRLGWFHFRVGFDIITGAVFLSLAVFVVGLILYFWWRISKPLAARLCLQASLLSLLPIIGIGSQLVPVRTLPAIHNITTDPIDPPQFDRVVALRGVDSNPLQYDAETLAPLQAKAYPEIRSLLVTMTAADAHTKAERVAEKLGWELVASSPEQGIIEATETSMLWGFKDDIVVRLRQTDAGTEVDLRSVSRVGTSDLGANAKRINAFLEAFQN